MKHIISIAEFTRFYFGADGGKKYGSKNIFYTDWCSALKVFDLIGNNRIKVELFVGYYSDEERKLDSEFLIGKKKFSPAMKNFHGWVAPLRLRKFIEDNEIDVTDYTYKTDNDNDLVWDSGHVGEIRIVFLKDDIALLCSLLQKLDAPKNIFKMLLENTSCMIKVFPDGKIHSIQRVKNFNDDYFEADFFEKFPEVKQQPK